MAMETLEFKRNMDIKNTVNDCWSMRQRLWQVQSAALAIGSENRSLGVVLLLSSVVVGCLSKNKDGSTLVENDERKVSKKEQDPETRKKQDPEIRKVIFRTGPQK